MFPTKHYEELERCWAWLDAAMSQDVVPHTHNIEDIWALIESGKAQLWPAKSAAVLTVVQTFPRQAPVLMVWLSGCEVGKLKEVIRLINAAEAWAREGGLFTHLVASGRRSWGRAYGNNGAKEQYTVFSKELK